MSLLVVGSVAIDSIETPFGTREESIGGSATYFSASASYFAPARLVAVIGHDFPEAPLAFLGERGVDLDGLVRSDGETFRWKGKYGYDLNDAVTLETHLNVFQDFSPRLSERYRESEYVFLANIHPALQLEVLDQVSAPKFVACDTMNLWIDTTRDQLERVFARVDMVVVNEGEARMFAGEANVVAAARAIQALGPKYVVIKRGEYGALLFGPSDVFFAPAYPLERVFDPTGAGDTFAGGMIGSIARDGDLSPGALRRATTIGVRDGVVLRRGL